MAGPWEQYKTGPWEQYKSGPWEQYQGPVSETSSDSSSKSESYTDALLYGVGQPLRNIGTTAKVLGAETIGGALESVPQPTNYDVASNRVVNPQEGDFSIGGVGVGSIPRAAVEQAGQLAGSLASRAAGAGLGAVVAGPPGALAGGVAGPTIFGAAQVLGQTALQRAQANGRETPNREDLLAAAGTAVASGLIDAASAKYVTEAAGPLLKRLGLGFITEGGPEAIQSIIEQAGGTAGTNQGLQISPKQAIAEGLIGGFTGGPAAGILGSNLPQEVNAGQVNPTEPQPPPPVAPIDPTTVGLPAAGQPIGLQFSDTDPVQGYYVDGVIDTPDGAVASIRPGPNMPAQQILLDELKPALRDAPEGFAPLPTAPPELDVAPQSEEELAAYRTMAPPSVIQSNGMETKQIRDAADQWDRKNRTSRSDEWFGGSALASRAFDQVSANNVPAHGMSKSATLSAAVSDLMNMLNNGFDAGRTLYTAGLTSDRGAGAATGTAGGHAYRDGPFIILFREGLTEQPTKDDITGVLVNPAHAEIAGPLQKLFPHLSIGTYDQVSDVLANRRLATANAAPTAQSSQIREITGDQDLPPPKAPPAQGTLALPENALREIAGLQAGIDRNERALADLPDTPDDPETQSLRTGVLDTISRYQRKIGDLRAQYAPRQGTKPGDVGEPAPTNVGGPLAAAQAMGKVGQSAADVPLPREVTPQQPRIGDITVPEGTETEATTGRSLTAPRAPGVTVAQTGTELERAAQRPGFVSAADRPDVPVGENPVVVQQRKEAQRKAEANALARREDLRKQEKELTEGIYRPKSLFQYIKAQGGIRLDDRNLGDRKGFPKSLLASNRQSGITLDEAASRAEQAGYRVTKNLATEGRRDDASIGGNTQDVDGLLEAIGRESAGKKVYAVEDEAAGARAQERRDIVKSYGKGVTGARRFILKENYGIDTQKNISAREASALLEQQMRKIDADDREAAALAKHLEADEVTNDDSPEIEDNYDPFQFEDDFREIAPARRAQVEAVQQDEQGQEDQSQDAQPAEAEDRVPDAGIEQGGEGIEEEDNAAIAEAVKAAGAREANRGGDGSVSSAQIDSGKFGQTQDNGDPLPSEAQYFEKKLSGKSLIEVAEFMATDPGVSPQGREIAKRIADKLAALKAAGSNLKFTIAHVGDSVPRILIGARGASIWNFKGDDTKVHVWINGPDVTGKVGVSERTILHELLHSSTQAAIKIGNLKSAAGTKIAQAVGDLYDLQNAIIKEINQRIADSKTGKRELTPFERSIYERRSNALLSVDETVAWGMTDPDAQAWLEQMPYKGKSMWSAFVQAIRKMFGFQPTADTALSEVMRITETLLETDQVQREMESLATSAGYSLQIQQPLDSVSNTVRSFTKRMGKMLGASGQPASKSELNSATALSTKGVPSEVDAPYKAGRDLATASRFTTFAQGVAAISPKFAKYMRRVLDQHYAERDLINRGETALRPAFELPDSSRPKINAVLEHDRLTGTDRTRFGQRVVVTMPANYQGTLAKPGQTITLSREETDGLRDIRKFLNDRWDDYGKAIAAEDGYKGEWSKEAIQAELKKAEAEDTKDRGRTRSLQYVAEIYDMAQEKKRTGYVPFNRSGDVAITVREKPGREPGKDMIGSGEVKAFEMLDASTPWEFIGLGRKSREQKVNERVRELRKKYPADVYEIKANDVTPNIIKQLDLPAFEQIIMALNIKDESTRKQFFTEVLGEIRNQRKASFTRDSKNTPGYSTDFFQSLIDYNRVSSVVTSMITHGREIDQAYTATQSEPKNIKAFAERYKNYLDSDEAVIGRLKQFGFWANIWGSPSSAIVNLIQTPTITAAQIAGWGGKGTWADVNANLARVGRYVRADKDGAKLDFSKFDFKGDTVQAAAFQQAIREGVLDPGVSQDLMGDEPSRFGAGRDTQKFFGRVFKIGASMFNTAEQINRTVAWLSAYKQASKPDGVKRFLSMYAKDERVQNMRRDGRLEPADIARFVVEDTQFIGGKFDRPEALRGAGGIAFQFKQYPLNYMRLLWGNFSRMGKEGRTAGLIMIATMLALSGLLGLPFAEDVINMSDALGKFITKIDPMIERELRMLIGATGWGSQGAEAILRGPSRMFGVDLSRRFGVGEIAPEADLLLSIPVLGATYGRMSEYFDRSARNQPIGAAGALAAPFVGKGPADVIRSVALAKEGLQTRGGDLKIAPDKTTLAQSAMKAVGLQPATVARVQEQDRNQQRLRYKTQDAENALRTSLASTLAKSISARKAGDTEKANAFLKQYQDNRRAALKAFRDEKVLEEKVNVPKPEALRDRALQMLNPDLRNKSAAKTKRKALADEDEFVSGRE